MSLPKVTLKPAEKAPYLPEASTLVWVCFSNSSREENVSVEKFSVATTVDMVTFFPTL
ncbi:hypothetical protein D9M68_958240 [compost metagenome]